MTTLCAYALPESPTDVLQSAADYLRFLWRRQRLGYGCLPNNLGLFPLNFIWLAKSYLAPNGLSEAANDPSLGTASSWHKGEVREELLQLRRDEWQEIRDLLLSHRAHKHQLEVSLAEIVAAGCLGGDHLWRDLGFTERSQLSALMSLCFPGLSRKNSGDMKWKKFFYRQLCEEGGHFVCRSPSCNECKAYDDCFGPEN